MKHLLCITTTLLMTIQLHAQTEKIDALKRQLYQSNADAIKLDTYIALLEERSSLPIDTVRHYINEAKKLNAKNNDTYKATQILLAEAALYLRTGNEKRASQMLDSASAYYTVKNEVARSLYFKLAEARMSCMDYSNNFNKATAIGYNIIREAEKYKDTVVMASVLNSIACWNYNMDFVRKAIDINLNALSVTIATPAFYEVRSGICINLGEAYWWQEQLDSAEYFIKKGISYAQLAQNLFLIYHGLQKMASLKISRRQFAEAEKDIRLSIKIYNKFNDGIPSSRNVIALANLYRHWEKTDSAISVLTKGIAADSTYRANRTKQGGLHKIDNMQDMYMYNVLGKCYKDKGDYEKYSSILEKIISQKDTIYKINTAEALADLQTKYDVQKKEATIANQNFLLAKRQNIIILIASAVLLLSAFAFFKFKEYRRKQRRRSSAAVKDAEEKERRRIAADLHDNLGVQANAILHTSEMLKGQAIDKDTLATNLNDTAKDMLFFLRETLWALKAADTTAQQLWLRILNFINQMKRNYPQLHFAANGAVPEDFTLSSARSLNLLMIIQEAVNNSIKHSGSHNIRVSSEIKNDIWHIVIKDDGSGFHIDEAKNKEESNGLKNMAERAKNSNFIFEVDTIKDEGTAVSIGISKAPASAP